MQNDHVAKTTTVGHITDLLLQIIAKVDKSRTTTYKLQNHWTMRRQSSWNSLYTTTYGISHLSRTSQHTRSVTHDTYFCATQDTYSDLLMIHTSCDYSWLRILCCQDTCFMQLQTHTSCCSRGIPPVAIIHTSCCHDIHIMFFMTLAKYKYWSMIRNVSWIV